MTNEQDFPSIADFDLERQQLARRRKIAADMLKSQNIAGMPENRMVSGRYVPPGAAEMMNSVLQPAMGRYENDAIDQREAMLNRQQREAQDSILSSIPSEQGDARRTAQLKAMQHPSLRDAIKVQMTGDAAEATRIEQGEQRAQDRLSRSEDATQRAAERQADREDRQAHQAQQDALYKRTAGQLAAAVGGRSNGNVKPPSGFRWTPNGDLEPITGGPADKSATVKPLTAKQQETQRGFMDLESSLSNYEQMLNSYDFQGQSAASPAKRAAMEGAYTDLQMKLKTLYELGAPQAGDLKLLSQAIPNPVDLTGSLRGAAFGSAPFKAKLSETRKLLSNSKSNFEKQFGRATPDAAAPVTPRTRVGSKAEFDALPSGTKWEMPDGRKGTK